MTCRAPFLWGYHGSYHSRCSQHLNTSLRDLIPPPCLPFHPSFFPAVVFLLLCLHISCHFLLPLQRLTLYFLLSFMSLCPFLCLYSVSFFHLLSGGSICIDRHFSSCPVIGCRVILGAMKNSCCCVAVGSNSMRGADWSTAAWGGGRSKVG